MTRFVVTHQKAPNDEVIGTSTFSFTDSVLDHGCAYRAVLTGLLTILLQSLPTWAIM